MRLTDARRVASNPTGREALTAWCGQHPAVTLIDLGPYDVTALRSDPAHDADQLKVTTRRLYAEALRIGLALTLWRSTPIGHWLEIDTLTVRRWITARSTPNPNTPPT